VNRRISIIVMNREAEDRLLRNTTDDAGEGTVDDAFARASIPTPITR